LLIPIILLKNEQEGIGLREEGLKPNDV